MQRNRLLIIGHDVATCKDIKYKMQILCENTDAFYTLTVHDGLNELARHEYDVVVLDSSFPETDGMELLKTLRSVTPMPIMLLATSAELDDKVEALKTGADDYLTKPFEIEECLARVYVLLRRVCELTPLKRRAYAIVTRGDLIMRREYRQVLRNGQPVDLTYREFEMLSLFMSNPERVYTFEQLYEQVWAEEYMDNKNSVICEVKRLRKKLGGTGLIENVREVGYRFKK